MIVEKRPVEGTEKRKSILLSLLITGLFFLCISIRYDFYYDLNDDTAIRDILSGIHSGIPSAHSIQMLYPLSWLLSLLYRMLPAFPWFGLFLSSCQVLCVFLIGYGLTGYMAKWWQQISAWLVYLFILTAALLYQFVFIQYTVVCGMLMATAAFRMGMASTDEKRIDICSLLLLVTAFQLRTEMCLMLLPFVGLILFCGWLQAGKWFTMKHIKKAYLGLVAAILLMAGCYLVNTVAYGGKQWKNFMEFFDQRTLLYDFIGFPSYEENQDFYEENGLKEPEYRLLENYNYSLDENWNRNSFGRLIAYRKSQAGRESSQPIYCYAGTYTTEHLAGALWTYKQRLLYPQSGAWYYVILALYVCILLVAILKKKGFLSAKLCLLFAGRSAIWLYLIVRNRMPERILMPLYLIEAMVLLIWLLEALQSFADQKGNRIKHWWITGISIILMVSAGTSFMAEQSKVTMEYNRREACNEDWEALRQYCKEHMQNYYLLDVYSTTAYSEKIYQNVDNAYRNYDLCGGWLAKSPLTEQKLARYNVSNPEKALKEQDNVFFIAAADKDITWLENYYDCKEYLVKVEKCDTIADSNGTVVFAVYCIKDRKA